MAGTIALFVGGVGVVLLAAAGSMWSRVLRDGDGEAVRATVTDAAIVESDGMNVEHGVAVDYRYRHDGTMYEYGSVVHPREFSGAESEIDAPSVPAEYREGATVTVEVPPDRPGAAVVPDPGIRATYRVAVPAIAVTGLVAVAVGAWLAL